MYHMGYNGQNKVGFSLFDINFNVAKKLYCFGLEVSLKLPFVIFAFELSQLFYFLALFPLAIKIATINSV